MAPSRKLRARASLSSWAEMKTIGTGRAGGVQPRLKFEAAHSRHSDVGNQAVCSPNVRRLQKLFPRAEDLSPKSHRVHQALECGSHRLFIIHNGNHRDIHYVRRLRKQDVRKLLYGGIRTLYLGIGATKSTNWFFLTLCFMCLSGPPVAVGRDLRALEANRP